MSAVQHIINIYITSHHNTEDDGDDDNDQMIKYPNDNDRQIVLICCTFCMAYFIVIQKVRLFGWKPIWVVLEKGVLSVFASR